MQIDNQLFDTAELTHSVRLADRFGYPPFSVLDAKSGQWQDRKRMWLSTGLNSEKGRDANLAFGRFDNFEAVKHDGTSIFDPVLCELLIRWFSGPGFHILDPFAGGSVRGIVASALGRRYYGIDINPAQVEANRGQLDSVIDGLLTTCPEWVCGDSRKVLTDWRADAFDMLLTCPPYFDLEQYTVDPDDLSNMSWAKFLSAYYEVWAKAASALKPDRFAAVVIGEVRDTRGRFRNLVGLTIDALQEAGLDYYNTAVLLVPINTASMRAPAQFGHSRKLCMTHQNVLVFVKGDPRKATEAVSF